MCTGLLAYLSFRVPDCFIACVPGLLSAWVLFFVGVCLSPEIGGGRASLARTTTIEGDACGIEVHHLYLVHH